MDPIHLQGDPIPEDVRRDEAMDKNKAQLPVLPQQGSSCTCGECVAACKAMPGLLGPDDLEHFDMNTLLASEGTATVMATGEKVRVQTIVPAQRDNGECVFLENGRCSVHEFKPAGCALTKVCEEQSMADMLALNKLYESVATDDDYANAWNYLTQAGRQASPVAERLAAYEAARVQARRKKHRRKR